MQMTPYAKALRDRVERGMRHLQKHGRMATQEELGPMPTLEEFPDELDDDGGPYRTPKPKPKPKPIDEQELVKKRRAAIQKRHRLKKRAQAKLETGLVGVHQNSLQKKRPWSASWWHDGKNHTRFFATPLEAAQFRNKKMAQLYPGDEDQQCDLETVARVYGSVLTE